MSMTQDRRKNRYFTDTQDHLDIILCCMRTRQVSIEETSFIIILLYSYSKPQI